ncbi:MAG: uracil-DNA glycosylase [Akkermansiaceae bacterium]|nr:uracil-DNA glycosylase [Akkermansiaceae bacterium]
MQAVDVLIDYLKAEEARGKSHILLDDESREQLRELYIKARDTVRAPAKPKAAPPATSKPASEPAPQISTAVPASEPETPPARIVVEGESREERLASLRQQAENWAPARAMDSLRDTMVFAIGNPEARLMLVGEAPGYEEERRQEPFVGPAGRKLDDILKAMGLSRETVYISNIVKFRPATPRQTTNNRKPTPEEMAVCLPFVMKEIEIVKPDCIIALGGTAAEGLLKLSGSVTSMREKWHAIDGIPTRVSYHPSYLLQSGSGNEVKRKLWEDMLAVMEKLGMAISEKQRSFFLPKS